MKKKKSFNETRNGGWRRLLVSSVIVLVVSLIGLSVSRAQSNPAAVVKMADTPAAFVPAKVTIKAGEKVEWDNTGKAMHSVTANPPLPAGAKIFDSGFMMPGGKFIYTFAVPGTYHYLCLPHANSGMAGEVIVTK
jgi:plastocyanin